MDQQLRTLDRINHDGALLYIRYRIFNLPTNYIDGQMQMDRRQFLKLVRKGGRKK